LDKAGTEKREGLTANAVRRGAMRMQMHKRSFSEPQMEALRQRLGEAAMEKQSMTNLATKAEGEIVPIRYHLASGEAMEKLRPRGPLFHNYTSENTVPLATSQPLRCDGYSQPQKEELEPFRRNLQVIEDHTNFIGNSHSSIKETVTNSIPLRNIQENSRLRIYESQELNPQDAMTEADKLDIPLRVGHNGISGRNPWLGVTLDEVREHRLRKRREDTKVEVKIADKIYESVPDHQEAEYPPTRQIGLPIVLREALPETPTTLRRVLSQNPLYLNLPKIDSKHDIGAMENPSGQLQSPTAYESPPLPSKATVELHLKSPYQKEIVEALQSTLKLEDNSEHPALDQDVIDTAKNQVNIAFGGKSISYDEFMGLPSFHQSLARASTRKRYPVGDSQLALIEVLERPKELKSLEQPKKQKSDSRPATGVKVFASKMTRKMKIVTQSLAAREELWERIRKEDDRIRSAAGKEQLSERPVIETAVLLGEEAYNARMARRMTSRLKLTENPELTLRKKVDRENRQNAKRRKANWVRNRLAEKRAEARNSLDERVWKARRAATALNEVRGGRNDIKATVNVRK